MNLLNPGLKVLALLLSTTFVFSQTVEPLSMPDTSQLKSGIKENIENTFKAVYDLVNDVTKTKKEKADAYGGYGLVLHAHNYREEANTAYANALKLAPDDIRWAYYLGFNLMEMGNLEESVKYFDQALTIDPNEYFALVRCGHVLLDLNRPQEAAEYFKKALAIDDASAFALYGLGRALSDLGEFDLAVTHLEKALSLQPDATTIHYPLGLAYRGAGNREKAREFLSQRGEGVIVFPDPRVGQLAGIVTVSSLQVVLAMAKDSASVALSDFEGYIRSNIASKKGSVTYLSDALKHKSSQQLATKDELAHIHYAIGVIQEFRGDDHQAELSYKSALTSNPQFIEPWRKLGHIYARNQRYQEEIDCYTNLLKAKPNQISVLLDRSRALRDDKQVDRAIEDLNRILQFEPNQVDALLTLAQLSEQARPQESLKIYDQLLSLRDEAAVLAQCRAGKGRIYLNQQKLEFAIHEFEQALAHQPEAADIRINLAAALAFKDKYSEAVNQYTKVLDDQPQNEAARIGRYAALILSEQFELALSVIEKDVLAMPQSMKLIHLAARLLVAAPDPSLRDGEVALDLLQKLDNLMANTSYSETLAMAYAQRNDFKQAQRVQSELIESARAVGDQNRVSWLYSNLLRYQAQQSCCTKTNVSVLLP